MDAYRLAVATDPANQAADAGGARRARDGGHHPGRRGRADACSAASRVAACEVRPVEAFKEKDAPFAYYFPPTLDGSRSGIYYVNTYDLPSRTYSKLASTTYHEAIPGHHFQISLEMEHPSLNVFRRLGSRLIGGAYVEGWGLYAERLADELGLYRNAGGAPGHARRAGLAGVAAHRGLRHARPRLVAPAVRSTGCSRPGSSATDAVIETDRYIELARPGAHAT